MCIVNHCMCIVTQQDVQSKKKSKGEVVPVHATNAYKRVRGTAPLILHLNTRWSKALPLMCY
jgi:hypothetical protein